MDQILGTLLETLRIWLIALLGVWVLTLGAAVLLARYAREWGAKAAISLGIAGSLIVLLILPLGWVFFVFLCVLGLGWKIMDTLPKLGRHVIVHMGEGQSIESHETTLNVHRLTQPAPADTIMKTMGRTAIASHRLMLNRLLADVGVYIQPDGTALRLAPPKFKEPVSEGAEVDSEEE
ncbi:MAG: hypothetical protein M1352_03590 [Patescibacteria group bacterium]|nr:hypothetical protein [Patescibacteria group bacterium]